MFSALFSLLGKKNNRGEPYFLNSKQSKCKNSLFPPLKSNEYVFIF